MSAQCEPSLEPSAVSFAWEPAAPLGPKAAFHVGGIIEDVLYIHGGIQEAGSNQPSNQFYKLSLETMMWEDVQAPGSPALSHHAAVVLEKRFFLLIGGWDGRRRRSDLHAYDTHKNRWLHMKHSGFPEGAGLSNHTANVLSDGSIVVIGREGSIRSQRRYGNIYILYGSVKSRLFIYQEYSHDVMSRSGHTANVIGKHIYIIGGRSDCFLEKANGFEGVRLKHCNVLSTMLKTLVLLHQTPLQRAPSGRKNHATVSDKNCILVHGGETFDGRREPVGEMFLISINSPVCFYKLTDEKLKRSGHVCFVLPDKILLHGGFSGKSIIHSDLYSLTVKP